MAKTKKKKGNTITVNFEGVKAFKTIPEGPYVLKITSAEKGVSSNDNDMISWEFEVAQGKHAGSKLWSTTSLNDGALWKLRELLEAAGQDVPDDEMDVDLDAMVDCELGANVFHEEYNGKDQAKISDFISVDEVDSDDEEDNKKSSKKKSSKKDEEEDEVPDVDSMDEDELAEFVSEAGLDVELEDFKNIKKKRAAVKEALEGSDDEEEEETEKYSEDAVNDMDADDLQKLNDDLDLGVEDLEDMKEKIARKAVIKALKKAKLLED